MNLIKYIHIYVKMKTNSKCFLCLDISRTRRCKRCKITAHKHCWKKYNRYHPYKRNNCPQCNIDLRKKYYNTRVDKKQKCIKTIDQYLNDVNIASTKEQKKTIAKKMFEYMYENMWFVNSNKKFKKTVQEKLIELYNIDKWEFALKIYKLMFKDTFK